MYSTPPHIFFWPKSAKFRFIDIFCNRIKKNIKVISTKLKDNIQEVLLLFDNVLSRHHPRSVVFLLNFIVVQTFSDLKHTEEFWLICETCEVQKCLGIIAVGYETVKTLDICLPFSLPFEGFVGIERSQLI